MIKEQFKTELNDFDYKIKIVPISGYGYGEADLQFEEVENVRRVAYRTSHEHMKATHSLNKNREEEVLASRSRELSPV